MGCPKVVFDQLGSCCFSLLRIVNVKQCFSGNSYLSSLLVLFVLGLNFTEFWWGLQFLGFIPFWILLLFLSSMVFWNVLMPTILCLTDCLISDQYPPLQIDFHSNCHLFLGEFSLGSAISRIYPILVIAFISIQYGILDCFDTDNTAFNGLFNFSSKSAACNLVLNVT